MEKIDVLYSCISLKGITIADAIKQAGRMGYRLNAFEGWSDADLGARFGVSKGPCRDMSTSNQPHIRAINEAFETFAILDISPDEFGAFPHGFVRAV